MTSSRDDSVMMALSELLTIERARVEEQERRDLAARAAEARAQAEAVLAEAREAEQLASAAREAHAARVAEVEARLRVEADTAASDRAASLRQEIDAIRADREAMRAALEQRLATPPGRGSSGWALAFGLASLVAASLAALLVARQPVVQAVEAPSRTVAAVPAVPIVPAAPVADPPAAPEARTAPLEASPEASSADTRAERGGLARSRRGRPEPRREADDELDRLASEHDDSDVLGGVLGEERGPEAGPTARRRSAGSSARDR